MGIRVNSWVKDLHAYVPGEQPKDPRTIKLNTNELPYPAAPEVVEALKQAATEAPLQKYPDPVAVALRERIGTSLGFDKEWLLAGNGSDEALRLICHAFLDAAHGDRIAMLDPTYVLYETLAAMFGCGAQVIPAGGGEAVLPDALVQSESKIVFLPNPNPPIGTFYPASELERLAGARPDRLVVLDEAYADFAPGNALDLVRRFPNVLVARTFSKSYALAGMRVGFVVGQPHLIAELGKIKDSYNLNRLSLIAAEVAWGARDYYEDCIAKVRIDRELLTSELRRRGFSVAASEGNFVFARHERAKELFEALRAGSILVRYFRQPSLADGFRITIGTRDELTVLLGALDQLLESGVAGTTRRA